ncbi:MAG: hypothetical protein JSS57_09775 [Proteobacteria bacterium]|nr:hypothetical protein [Pseudomonadota bacterium]
MKLVCSLVAVSSSIALAAPSANVVDSCIQAQAQGNVKATEVPTREILQEDGYKPGYTAEYVEFDGEDVGFALSKKGGALLLNGKLWPTKRAVILPGAENVAKLQVRIELANWLMLDEGNNKYLCVVDNFDGLGRSGSFQKYRYAYILKINNKKGLFFAVGKVR